MCTYLNWTSTLHCLLQSSSVNVSSIFIIYMLPFLPLWFILFYTTVSSSYSVQQGRDIIKTVILHFYFQNARTDTTCPVWSLSGSEAGQDRTWWKAPSEQTRLGRVYEEWVWDGSPGSHWVLFVFQENPTWKLVTITIFCPGGSPGTSLRWAGAVLT